MGSYITGICLIIFFKIKQHQRDGKY